MYLLLKGWAKKEGNGGLPTPPSNYANLMHTVIVACLIIFEAKLFAVVIASRGREGRTVS
jgi:hypothetical protein